MPKRKSTRGIGGGTGDINPQWFNLGPTTMTAAFTNASVTLPRERLPYGNKSQVMEVLKVEYSLAPAHVFNVTAGTDSSSRVYVTTSSFGTAEPTAAAQSGKVISKWTVHLPSEGTGLSSMIIYDPYIEDLTDGAGNGILVATDTIFVGNIQTAATSPINTVAMVRLLYRWKNVGLAEYIGIVQSQQ